MPAVLRQCGMRILGETRSSSGSGSAGSSGALIRDPPDCTVAIFGQEQRAKGDAKRLQQSADTYRVFLRHGVARRHVQHMHRAEHAVGDEHVAVQCDANHTRLLQPDVATSAGHAWLLPCFGTEAVTTARRVPASGDGRPCLFGDFLTADAWKYTLLVAWEGGPIIADHAATAQTVIKATPTPSRHVRDSPKNNIARTIVIPQVVAEVVHAG